MERYKLDSMEIQNFKGLTAFSFQAQKKRITLFRGPNRAGKSSVIQAVQTLFCGDKASPVETIKDGQDQASVIGILKGSSGDDLKITHRWERREDTVKHTLDVERISKDGRLGIKKPQSAIDELIDTTTLDPTVFYREKSAEKRTELIQRAAKLDIYKLSDFALKIQKAEDERKRTKASLIQAEASLVSIAKLCGDDDAEDIETLDADAKNKERALNRMHCSYHETKALEDRRAGAITALASFDREIASVESQLKSLMEQREASSHRLNDLAVKLDEQPKFDEKEIEQKKNEVKAAQSAVATAIERKKTLTLKAETEAKVTALGTESNKANADVGRYRIERRQYIDQGLADAGLAECFGIDDDGKVTIFGHPSDDASESEKLRASARCSMATKPAVRVMCIDNADSLGPDAITELDKIAGENDFQLLLAGVWMNTEVADTFEIMEGANAS